MKMKTFSRLALIWLVLWQTQAWGQEFPQAQISKGDITAKVYLPDAKDGYYRGSRFDWSGVVFDLSYKGHSYFGQWFDKHDPFLHDAIMGPVEAFDPLGYQEAKVGQVFTKIGVGLLQRLDSMPYQFSKSYKIVDHGKWQVKKGKDKIEFLHLLDTGEFRYRYTKVIRIKDNQLIIGHTLVNEGDSAIKTSVFNHNFFFIDNATIGPGYRVRFPFTIEGDDATLGQFAEVNGKEVIYKKELSGSERARIRSITGYGNSPSDYNFYIENTKTGAGVRISCDKPLSRLLLWSAPKALCPEPYVMISIKPSESFSWSIKYDYYTL